MSFTHSKQMCFALVDCNNFYASCERLFDPTLNNKPVIILSSNDGCVIARSNEAKSLGIQMSQPYFQIEKLCRQHKVRALSSNFALYGDISHRVMMVLKNHCIDMEIYSIDEAFLRLDKIGFSESYDYAQKIRQTVLQHVGIPVSIGIAKTKTLAKMASHLAKKNHPLSKNNVCDLREDSVKNKVLERFPVESLWGVGRKSAQQLQMMKINFAQDLCNQDTAFLKKRFSVMMTRVVLELRGVSCLTLEEISQKKNITCSRSFGKPVSELNDLLEAISAYAARACEKARSEKTKAQSVLVYLRTSPFSKMKFYSASDAQQLLCSSNDTCYITAVAQSLLKKIYKPGFLYQKTGIILCDLISEKMQQSDLFCENSADNQSLMKTVDHINHRFGSHCIFLAAEGIKPDWIVKSTKKSQSYTTNWKELKNVTVNNRIYCLSKLN